MNIKSTLKRFFEEVEKKGKLDGMSRRYRGDITNRDIAAYFNVTEDAIFKQAKRGILPLKKMIPICIELDLDINSIFNKKVKVTTCDAKGFGINKGTIMDGIFSRVIANMIVNEIITEIPPGSKGIGELIGKTSSDIRNHRGRNTVPYKEILDVCIENKLDMNYIFKGEKNA